MSDDTRDMLVRGIAAAKAKSKDEARYYLKYVARNVDAEHDEIIQAWRYLAQIADNPREKRDCLEQVLAEDSADPEARRALAILNGELNPSDIVDPDRMPASAQKDTPSDVAAQRFVCANCGGRMAFTPDNNSLTCAYCGRRQSLVAAMEEGALFERDFAIALATAKGHSRPAAVQSINCQGCGAAFLLSPEMISKNCPYCANPYVVEQIQTRELVAPEGVIPFAVTRNAAQDAVMNWYHDQGFKILSANALPVGVYLPVWTFDVGGTIGWNYLTETNKAWLPQSGSELVYENDLLVAASHSLSAPLSEEVISFSPDRLVPYNARYLADWAAETYQIELGDASLVARSRVFEKYRPQVQATITDQHKDLRLSGLHLVIESYKLILVPLWIARYHYDRKWYTVAVNGQSGKARGEKPLKGMGKWFAGMFSNK